MSGMLDPGEAWTMRRSLFCSLLLAVLCGTAMPARAHAGDVATRLPFAPDQELKRELARFGTRMVYHGGPVMTGSKNLYVIYYGSFTGTQHDILDNFLANLGGSGAFSANTTYYDAQRRFLQNVLTYAPETNSYDDAYSLGTALSGRFDTTIVKNAIADGHLPADSDGMYLVTISTDVTLPRTVWCAYHSHSSGIVPGMDITYAVAPNLPPSLFTGCSGNVATYHDTTSPNDDIGMDAVCDSLIHEISEAATDPDLDAWFTRTGAENGDLCNFVYGSTFPAANGSHANVTLGARDYLVQQIWDRAASVCANGP
jgi:Phosphate-induced protein 1 conserved region